MEKKQLIKKIGKNLIINYFLLYTTKLKTVNIRSIAIGTPVDFIPALTLGILLVSSITFPLSITIESIQLLVEFGLNYSKPFSTT